MAEKVLDVRGQVCPMPVLKTKDTLEKLSSGDILEVIVDYPPSKENVKRFAESQGHEILEIKEEGEIIRLKIRKR